VSPLAYKVYRGGKLVAATRWAEEAAAILALGNGGLVKVDGRLVYRQGVDGDAGDSFDAAAGIMLDRRREHELERQARLLHNCGRLA